MSTTPQGFDRVRPRSLDEPVPPRSVGPTPDPEGRRMLFSRAAEQVPAPAAFGAVTVRCSACGEQSAVGLRQAVGLALPSVHLPLLRRGHPSWMRCPACGRRTWVRLGIRL